MADSGAAHPSAPPAGHRLRNLAILTVVVVVLVVLVALAIVPVAQSATYSWGSTSSGTATTTFNDSHGETIACASGARGTLVFSSDGIDSRSTVLGPDGTTLWSSGAPNWTTQFAIPGCGLYQFYTNGTGVGVYQYTLTVRWSAPLI